MKLKIYDLIKEYVNKSNLTNVILSNDMLIEKDDLIHDLYVKFFDMGYDERYNSDGGLTLNSYIYKFVRWCLIIRIRDACKIEIINKDIDCVTYNDYSPEQQIIDQEIIHLLNSFAGTENIEFVEGKSQTDLAKELGVSRQAINYLIKKQRIALKKEIEE